MAEAHRYLTTQGLNGGADVAVCDMFVSLSPRGDADLLSRVLADWGDGEAARILRTCATAAPATAGY
ncbi:methyltransferase [Streptomyces sp. NPDC090442]|uniref:methyltransferase n=1 Tax=Streptomyces sp. NPDC090442 TaxID=3365962 RepID=UPI0037F16B8F